eukprot:5706394-Pyramimonas_sp.AAC.1
MPDGLWKMCSALWGAPMRRRAVWAPGTSSWVGKGRFLVGAEDQLILLVLSEAVVKGAVTIRPNQSRVITE